MTVVPTTMDAAEESGVPYVLVRHVMPAESPIFAAGSATGENHSAIAAHEAGAALRVEKTFASVFAGTDLEAWLRDRGIDTVTLAGFMTNYCVLASTADAEPRGFTVEVLSDATGAIDLANEAGRAPARQVHETLMALLHSNWAAVADTGAWIAAVRAGTSLPTSDLVTSATQGRTGA